VATPGRLLDLIKKGLVLDAVKYLFIDEADEMLSMGFQEDLDKIFRLTVQREPTWIFSATFQKAALVDPKPHVCAGTAVESRSYANSKSQHRSLLRYLYTGRKR